MKKEIKAVILQAAFLLAGAVFLILSITSEADDNHYLPLALVCINMGSVINIIRLKKSGRKDK